MTDRTSTLAVAAVIRQAGATGGKHRTLPAPNRHLVNHRRRRKVSMRTVALTASALAVCLLAAATLYFLPASRPVGATTAAKTAVEFLGSPELVPSLGQAAYPPLPEVTEVVTRIDTQDPVVFITIDDGWTLDPRVLDLLRERRAPITVFPVGELLEPRQDFWRAFIELGGTVEDHSQTHPFLGKIPGEGQVPEICGPADRIQSLFGRRPTMMRPPYGSLNDETKVVTPDCGQYHIVKWSVEVRNRQVTYANPEKRLSPGDIVLLHFRPETYDELVDLFAQMDALGLRAAPLQDYLGPFARTDAQRAASGAVTNSP